jgi:hypothetical protein
MENLQIREDIFIKQSLPLIIKESKVGKLRVSV